MIVLIMHLAYALQLASPVYFSSRGHHGYFKRFAHLIENRRHVAIVVCCVQVVDGEMSAAQ